MLSWRAMFLSTTHLARRSNNTTAKAIRKWYLRMACSDDMNSCSMPILIFPLLEHRAAALANPGVLWVFADVGGIIPATLAFLPRSLADLHTQAAGAVAP